MVPEADLVTLVAVDELGILVGGWGSLVAGVALHGLDALVARVALVVLLHVVELGVELVLPGIGGIVALCFAQSLAQVGLALVG